MRGVMQRKMSVLVLASAAACSGDTRQAQQRSAQAPNDEAKRQVSSQVIDQQGASLRGEQAAAEQRVSRLQGDGHDATAKANLAPSPGSSAEGTAALRELGSGVQIELQVQSAVPGASRVAVRDTGNCEFGDAGEKVSASSTVPSETGLGTLLVSERGAGKLDLTLKDANLKTEGRGSLLGKTLTVYRMLPPAKPGERAEQVVACGQIVPG